MLFLKCFGISRDSVLGRSSSRVSVMLSLYSPGWQPTTCMNISKYQMEAYVVGWRKRFKFS